MPPPPPPPLPGSGPAPPPPPPPSGFNSTAGFKIVPGLGDALHEMKRRISGVEETPACAEGVASDDNRITSTPTGVNRPKSWHGSQVPGKPGRNNAMLSEMQSKLQKRKEKVDKEAYVVQTPENALPPTGPKQKPPLHSTDRKSSTPLRGWTPPVDFGARRASKDSGRDSWTPTAEYEGHGRISVDYSQYRKVSVDLDRKEELCLAKAIRKSSAKMLGRTSPSVFESNSEENEMQSKKLTTPPPAAVNIPPPSPVVMRYWKQCSNGGIENDDVVDIDKNGQSDEPAWKTDALEGEVTEFPSIKNKIANMEEEAKPKMFVVPDVKSKMRQAAPAAGWMEARTKLQSQLDTLINRTSAKMTKYGTVHAVEPKEFTKESSSESEKYYDAKSDKEESPKPHKLTINNNIKSLIKSVANEIQKSFSSKNIPVMGENTEDENDNKDIPVEKVDTNNGEYWRNLTAAVTAQQNIDMEAPIDFDYNEPKVEIQQEKGIMEDEDLTKIIPTNTSLEDPVDFDSTPIVLDASAARSKAKLLRKSSTERRLPASVLAKKKAAGKLKEIITRKIDACTGSDEPSVIDQIKRDLIDASFQVDLSSPEDDLENLDDEAKADLLAKQISKMESNYVMKLLKKIEKGVLDISIPLLMPFLSLQVKLKMGTNIFKGLEPEKKKKVFKETFMNDMIDDITDIALLQEVLERTQEKLNILNPPKSSTIEDSVDYKSNDNPIPYYDIENDSFELSSVPVRIMSPVKEQSPELYNTPDIQKENSTSETEEKSSDAFPDNIVDETLSKNINEIMKDTSDTEVKKSEDEGCPSSEFDSSSDDDKDEKKATESKIIECKKEKEDDEDEGICKDSEKELNSDTKKSNEKVIKQRILNIIENAKTMDQKRTGRNFGRTFEFQNVQLKPIVPNDRRPAKAKCMDNMWTQTIAKKQGIQINHVPETPKPKVPWTMKKNTQPEKKGGNKEVDDFDKCRDTLKKGGASTIPALGKDIKTIQKMTSAVNNSKMKETKEAEIAKVNIKEESKKVSPSPMAGNETERDESSKVEAPEKNEPVKEPSIKEKATEKPTEIKEKIIIEEIQAIKNDVVVEKVDCKEVQASIEKVNTDENNKIEDVIKRAENHIVEKKEELMKGRSKEELQKDVTDSGKSSRCSSKVSNVSDQSDEEWDPKSEDKNENRDIECTSEIKSKDTAEEIRTPVVRRRGDTVTIILPPPAGRPPPPPMFRPPPPPMSPPVPESKVKDLERENKLIMKVDDESDTESEYEEESEWEWTEEDETESESECEVKKEGWENIMASSKGPTTFKAEYSVKVGGK